MTRRSLFAGGVVLSGSVGLAVSTGSFLGIAVSILLPALWVPQTSARLCFILRLCVLPHGTLVGAHGGPELLWSERRIDRRHCSVACRERTAGGTVAIGLVGRRHLCAVARTVRSAGIDCAASRTDRMGIADGRGRPSFSCDWLRWLCPHAIHSGLSGGLSETHSRVRGCSCSRVQCGSPQIARTSNRVAGH